MDWALRLVLLIGIPAGVALFILAEPMIATLFHYGAMQDRDVLMAGMSLKAYSLGLVAFMLTKVLAPGYFARQDTGTPVKIAIIAMVANMACNLMLVFWLQHVGLALATTMSAFLNAGLLFLGLRKAGVFKPEAGWWLYGARLLAANVTMAGVLLWMEGDVQQWLEWSLWQRTGQMGVTVIAGLGGYVLTLLLVGVRPRDFRH